MQPPIPDSLIIPAGVTVLLDKALLFERPHIPALQSTDLGVDKDLKMRLTTQGWWHAGDIFVLHYCKGSQMRRLEESVLSFHFYNAFWGLNSGQQACVEAC